MNRQPHLSIMGLDAERIQRHTMDKERPMHQSIPQIYYQESILDLIDNYIEEGYYNYTNLVFCDQECLVAECLTALGLDSFDTAINLNEVLNDLVKVLKTGKSENVIKMVTDIRMSTIKYFENILNELFDERRETFKNNRLKDWGYIQQMDMETGERIWRKSA